MNVMLVSGHYLGNHHMKIPGFAQRLLSRDAGLFAQGPGTARAPSTGSP